MRNTAVPHPLLTDTEGATAALLAVTIAVERLQEAMNSPHRLFYPRLWAERVVLQGGVLHEAVQALLPWLEATL